MYNLLNLCYLRVIAPQKMYSVASPKRFDRAQASQRLLSFALCRLGILVHAVCVCVMTVQGSSYLDKWSCLHQTEHTEDMAPSRQMVFIFHTFPLISLIEAAQAVRSDVEEAFIYILDKDQ